MMNQRVEMADTGGKENSQSHSYSIKWGSSNTDHVSKQVSDESDKEDGIADDGEEELRWAWVHAAGSISGWRTLDEFKSLFGGMWRDLWRTAERDDVPSREEFAKFTMEGGKGPVELLQ